MGAIENLLFGIFTLAIWSLVYRENIVYRIAEYFYTGFAAALILVQGWESAKKIALAPLLKGEYIWGLVFILAIPFILFFYKRTRPLYMIPTALLVGIGTGIGMRGAIHTQIIGQLAGSMRPLIQATPLDTLNTILITIGTFGALSYFLFTTNIRGPLKVIPRIGRIFIMAGLGGAFANTGMGRFANMSGVLLNLWNKTEAIYVIAGALIVIAIDVLRQRMK